MSHIYDQRKRPQGPQSAPPEPTTAPGPSMDALMAGTARPTAEQKGRPIDLDAAMKAKMEHAFGDLSNLKLYESRAVGEAGAEAIAQGNEIAFAPGMANFSTRSGQERLGHELSHVMSQRSEAVRGAGFLANSALEAQADREGAMAAAGEQVYTGPVTHALSDASPSPSVAGPMQAKRRDEDAQAVKEMQEQGDTQNWSYALKGSEGYDDLNPEEWEEKTHRPGFSKLWGKKDQTFKVRKMTPEKRQASEDADNLFSIFNGMNYVDPETKGALTNDNQEDWYVQTTQHPTIELMREIGKRKDKAAKKMVSQRDKIAKKNKRFSKSRANYETAFTDAGIDYDSYQQIFGALTSNASYEDLNQQIIEEMDSAPEKTKDTRLQANEIMRSSPFGMLKAGEINEAEYNQLEAMKTTKEPIINRRRKKWYDRVFGD